MAVVVTLAEATTSVVRTHEETLRVLATVTGATSVTLRVNGDDAEALPLTGGDGNLTVPERRSALRLVQALRLFDLDPYAGDPAAAFALYLLLAAHVDHVTVSDGSDRHDRREEILGPERVGAAGLSRVEAVLPYPPRSFPGIASIRRPRPDRTSTPTLPLLHAVHDWRA